MALKDDPEDAPDEIEISVSRRAFLKTVGATSVAAGVLNPPEADAQTAGAAARFGPGPVSITLRVNGRAHTIKVEPRVTLLDALRNRLDLTGLKRVCDRGSCGACTALVDGRAVYTCSMLAVEAADKEIRTVEGLVSGTVLHPVQQALCDHDGTMCGFCTPGFVMSAVSLLERHPKPTAEQARAALDGNICRCGTYPQVLEAVLNTKEGRRV
jgi:aerobic-type carbon monoxide dehydrogenase small subunit (CoxS/CutS family)